MTDQTPIDVANGDLVRQVSRLRQQLVEANERNLNAIDALTGAQAAEAQARKDIDGIFDRLHRREQELKALKELLGFRLETPLAEIAARLAAAAPEPDLDPAPGAAVRGDG